MPMVVIAARRPDRPLQRTLFPGREYAPPPEDASEQKPPPFIPHFSTVHLLWIEVIL